MPICISETEINNQSSVGVNYNYRGQMTSADYFTPDGDLYKRMFYCGSNIAKINYYRNEHLAKVEEFENDLLVSRKEFKKDGSMASEVTYNYDKMGRLRELCKRCDKTILVCYAYDSLDRIIERKIYVENKLVKNQKYSYDVLNRIVQYQDENQEIIVSEVSQKNELISYTIIDKMGNMMHIRNHFTQVAYDYTEIISGQEHLKVENKSYVDNIMLKKPYATEEDLDLIIAKIFNSFAVKRENNKTNDLLDKNIKMQTLPISIRKRILFDIATK